MDNFTELDKFARNTYSHELEYLACIMKTIKSEKLGKGLIDLEPIGLFGHSRGVGIAILYASRNNMIQGLVVWSSISTVGRYSRE